MASIETDLAVPQTQVEVVMADGRAVPAIVDSFPIYDPEKTRPRS
jgi:glycine cleavage system aminomethyltransferase T